MNRSILAASALLLTAAALTSAAEKVADPSSHWAFRAPVRPSVPPVGRRAWPQNPLDSFVLARLEAEGIAPAEEADRLGWLRRASLDLTGLPPSLEEADAFRADPAPNAHAAVIERLLASPHHGERWGRKWLDAARYADSDGYEKDKAREVWFYRDWVIDAINADLPYDRFVIEQIAGDLLAPRDQTALVATGFLRNSMINEEGGIDPEQFRMEAMFDRMDAIGKSILGLTVQCSQCHDHKYDPFTQRDYYRLFAFINDAHEANVSVFTPEERSRRAALFAEIRAIEESLRERHPGWREEMARWEERVRGDQPEWTVLHPEVDEISTGGQRYLPRDDGSFLAQGYAPTKHTVTLTARTELTGITGFRLELLTDPDLPRGGPGRSLHATCALTEFEVEIAPAGAPEKRERVVIAAATADVEPPEEPLLPLFDDRSGKRRVTGGIDFAIDGKDETAWGIDIGPGRRNTARKAVFVAAAPIGFPEGTIVSFSLRQNHGGWNSDDNQNHNLGRFRLSVTTAPAPVADPLPAAVRRLVDDPAATRTATDEAALFSYWRSTAGEWSDANRRIEELWKTHPEGSTQLVLVARPEPRTTHVLQKGDFLKPEGSVDPGTPAFLHPLAAQDGPRRLAFARWLVDRDAPTTARALVNRVWQEYFGTGLVASSEDLGTQSEPPTHPELLDWLAVEFMDSGWSMKRLHRLIALSATYRQSSRYRSELASRDPYNRLLARGPRLRLDGELVRDTALAASGLLERRIGGPSVHPPLPEFMLLPPVSYGPKVWPRTSDTENYRRALYTFSYRSLPYPALEAFDVPNGDASCVRRARSNTPLQALVTLNEPVFVQCARALARRALRAEDEPDAARLALAFRACVTRPPSPGELAELTSFLDAQRRRFAAAPGEAALAAGAGAVDLTGDAASELAAWTAVARVILNLDETITKD